MKDYEIKIDVKSENHAAKMPQNSITRASR